MRTVLHPVRAGRGIALLATIAALCAGCASANKTSSSASSSTSGAMAGMPGMSSSTGAATSAGTSHAASVDGITPVPTQMLANATWQGMKIKAMAMTAVPFVIFDGTSERMVKPPPHTSFHLMVELSDAVTNVPIPYATVWATISRGAKVVYDERQWPMISRYMGPHYGNDVGLPGAGTYRLSLLVSPPVSARHVEYQNVWVKPHRVTMTFHWKPVS